MVRHSHDAPPRSERNPKCKFDPNAHGNLCPRIQGRSFRSPRHTARFGHPSGHLPFRIFVVPARLFSDSSRHHPRQRHLVRRRFGPLLQRHAPARGGPGAHQRSPAGQPDHVPARRAAAGRRGSGQPGGTAYPCAVGRGMADAGVSPVPRFAVPPPGCRDPDRHGVHMCRRGLPVSGDRIASLRRRHRGAEPPVRRVAPRAGWDADGTLRKASSAQA